MATKNSGFWEVDPVAGHASTSKHEEAILPQKIGTILDQEGMLFEAVIGIGTEVMHAVFQTMYCHPEMRSEEGKLSLEEWFPKIDISKNTIKKLDGNFNQFHTNPMTDGHYDLTFYFWAVSLNESVYEKYLTEACRSDINTIKRIREKLCHMGLPFDNAEDTLRELQDVYKSVLNAVAVSFNNKTSTKNIVKKIPSKFNAIKKKKRQTVTKYCEQMRMDLISSDNKLNLLAAGQKELNTRRFEQNFTNPFYWILEREEEMNAQSENLFDLRKVFTSPWLQINERSTLKAGELFTASDSSGQLPRVVLISGHGGCGKTTLCQQIFSEWQRKATDKPSFHKLRMFDLVVFVELRNANCKTLSQFLKKNLLVNTLKSFAKKNDFMSFFTEMEILYLIDGFDERNKDTEQLVKDIAKNLSSTSRVILTTRPGYLREAKTIFSHSSTILVDLKGFDNASSEQYSKKIFNICLGDISSESLHAQFCAFLKEKRKVLQEHLNFPMTLALLCRLWLDYKETPNFLDSIISSTQLYLKLFVMLKSKLQCRKLVSEACVSMDSIQLVLNQLSEVALLQLPSAKLNLSKSDYDSLNHLCKQCSLPTNEFMSAFLVYDWSEKNPQFLFLHKTEMEYLSAVSVATQLMHVPDADINVFLKNEDKRKYLEVLSFLAGCLTINGSLDRHTSAIFNLVKDAQISCEDYNFFCHLLAETESESPCHSLSNTFCKNPLCTQVAEYLPSYWNLDVKTVISGLKLLMHCFHVDIEGLEINLSHFVDPENDETLVDLCDSLSKLQWALKRRNKKMIEVSLHIRSHLTSDAVSDVYLSYLYPWAKLVKFTGHLGDLAANHLFFCTNLKDLHIKISSEAVFNDFIIKLYLRFNKLKKITLVLPSQFDVKKLRKIPESSACRDVRLEFRNVSHNDLDNVLDVIQHLPDQSFSRFDRVHLQGRDLNASDGCAIVNRLQQLVFSKVIVVSDINLKLEQTARLKHVKSQDGNKLPLPFKMEWNGHIV